MEILVTASIGLIEVNGRYYMQIISADEYQFYYAEVSIEKARKISVKEQLEIEHLTEIPKGDYLLLDKVHNR